MKFCTQVPRVCEHKCLVLHSHCQLLSENLFNSWRTTGPLGGGVLLLKVSIQAEGRLLNPEHLVMLLPGPVSHISK